MCLAVVKDFKIKTVESPITVYKEVSYDDLSKTATSKYQGFEYERGKIVTCEQPFLTLDRDNVFSFCLYDSIEAVAVNKHFGLGVVSFVDDCLRQLWFKGYFELIQTGFHFCFGNEKQSRIIPKMYEFLIPPGAHIITGIDDTIGVTDQIMLV